MPPKRNLLVSVITRFTVCAVLLAGAGLVFTHLVETRPQPATTDNANHVQRLVVFPARAVAIRRQWHGFGTAQAMDSADVPARVTTTVVSIPENVLAGNTVKQGQLLARLDDSDFVSQVEISTQALAEFDAQLKQLEIEQDSLTERRRLEVEDVQLARNELQRVERLLDRQAGKQTEVDEAKRTVIQAERARVTTDQQLASLAPRRRQLAAQQAAQRAQLRLAELSVERSVIASPLNGVLETVDIEVGENLRSGERVARVVSLSHVEVPLQLPAAARTDIAAGDEVKLTAANGSGQCWIGHLARVAPVDDESSRTVAVYVEVKQSADAPDLLVPGMFVEGSVTASREQQRWIVPERSVQGGRIQIIENKKLESRPVQIDFVVEREFHQLGLTDHQWAVLAQPLDDDTLIVVNPSKSVLDGERVEPTILSAATPTAMRRQESVP